MRKKYKGQWTMKVDGLWYDKINHKFTNTPDFERGNYSTNYDAKFKKHITRKLNFFYQTYDSFIIHVLYWTTKKGKRVLKEYEFIKEKQDVRK